MARRLVEVEWSGGALCWQRSLLRFRRSAIATSSGSEVQPAYLDGHHHDGDHGEHVGCGDSVLRAQDHKYVSLQRFVDERPDGCAHHRGEDRSPIRPCQTPCERGKKSVHCHLAVEQLDGVQHGHDLSYATWLLGVSPDRRDLLQLRRNSGVLGDRGVPELELAQSLRCNTELTAGNYAS